MCIKLISSYNAKKNQLKLLITTFFIFENLWRILYLSILVFLDETNLCLAFELSIIMIFTS